jgi:hypothetical protein
MSSSRRLLVELQSDWWRGLGVGGVHPLWGKHRGLPWKISKTKMLNPAFWLYFCVNDKVK